jgi:alkylation response protein AidB-like acyl-CoA dehydrogenase
MSGEAGFNQISLTGVLTGTDTVLGGVGAGWRVAMTTVAHERGTFGITLTARLAAELERLVRTAVALGVEEDPVLRREIAELHVRVQGLRFTGYRALATLERTGEPGPESSIVKLGWSLANQRLSALALRLVDGAEAPDAPVAAMNEWGGYWRRQRLRGRTNTIEGGTSEILRGVVAERVLGLPRSR